MKDKEANKGVDTLFKALYGIDRPKDLQSLIELYRTRRDRISSGMITDLLWDSLLHFINETCRRPTPEEGKKRGPSQSYPPIRAERILHLLIKFEDREIIDGDLYEEYEKNLERHDRRHAVICFYKRVAYSLWPLLKERIQTGVTSWLDKLFKRRSS